MLPDHSAGPEGPPTQPARIGPSPALETTTVMLRHTLAVWFVAALTSGPISAAGQTVATTTGAIVGNGRDTTGAVLPNVTITISSDAIIPSLMVIKRCDDGNCFVDWVGDAGIVSRWVKATSTFEVRVAIRTASAPQRFEVTTSLQRSRRCAESEA